MNNIIYRIIDLVDKASIEAMGYASILLYALIGLDVVIFGLFMVLGEKQNIEDLVKKVLSIALMVFLFNNFGNFVSWTYEYVVKAVTISVPDKLPENLVSFAPPALRAQLEEKAKFKLEPDYIINYARFFVIGPLQLSLEKANDGNWFPDIGRNLFFVIVQIGIYVCFIAMAVQLAVAQFEFHFMQLLAIVVLPFNATDQTKFMGEKALSAVFGQIAKLAIISAVITISITTFRSFVKPMTTFNMDDMVYILGCSILMLYLSWQAPSLATSLLSGIPALSMIGALDAAQSFFGSISSVGSQLAAVGNGVAQYYDRLYNSGNMGGGGGGGSPPPRDDPKTQDNPGLNDTSGASAPASPPPPPPSGD